MTNKIEEVIKLKLISRNHGIMFSGPYLPDYVIVCDIKGGMHDGERLWVNSSNHVYCGMLGINTGLISINKQWRNKLDGCE